MQHPSMRSLITITISLMLGSGGAWSLNDPTRPFAYQAEPEVIEVEVPSNSEEWKLNGIQIRGDKRSAIINGNYVKEGEYLGSALVKAIHPAYVVLESGNQRLKIHLLELKVKKSSVVRQDNTSTDSSE